jgi:UDP-N-acetylmuramate dehydrogenase
MLSIQKNFPLKSLNTFAVSAEAAFYTDINTESDLAELFADEGLRNLPRLVLGGGSNVLFTADFDGLVIRMNIKGIRSRRENSDVFVTAGAGEVWNDLVNYCVSHDFAGMENLSLIPGSVGASPVQNIGAYGVELMDIFYSCRAFEIATGTMHTFYRQDCNFSYRESIFKQELKGQMIITEVTYKLSLTPSINISYGAITAELEKRGIVAPTIRDVSSVVSAIRVSKLPDPATIGNAGSFFKNPVVEVDKFRQIQSVFPDTVHYCMPNSTVKLAAGWLIEQCGWKGKKIGETGTWKNQALVLVNYGNASGTEIYDLSEAIIQSVKDKFGVLLEREVNVL